jgi:transposase-like protein
MTSISHNHSTNQPMRVGKGIRYSDELKTQILTDIQTNGLSISQASKQYGLAYKTIYQWIHKHTVSSDGTLVPSGSSQEAKLILANNKLKKENQELLEMIGKLTVIVDKIKKKEF